MKNCLSLLFIVLVLNSCLKVGSKELIREVSHIQNLFPLDGLSKWDYSTQYDNEIINCSLDLNDLETGSFFCTMINDDFSIFRSLFSNKKEYTNDIELTKTDEELILTYNEKFKSVKLDGVPYEYDISFGPYDLVMPSSQDFYNTTFSSVQTIKAYYQNLDDNSLSFEEDIIVKFEYTYSLIGETSFNDIFFEDVLHINITVSSDSSNHADFDRFNNDYFIDHKKGLISFKMNYKWYYLY